ENEYEGKHKKDSPQQMRALEMVPGFYAMRSCPAWMSGVDVRRGCPAWIGCYNLSSKTPILNDN
ncbi:MAG: hypothetical protein ACR2PY_08430, partial [Salinispira sp.]